MKKIGTSKGKTLVLLTKAEFTKLSGRDASDTPDDTIISLTPILSKLSLVNAKEAELKELKNLCANITDKLTSIGL